MDIRDMLSDLVAVSHKYGSDPDYVLAGGGNTSCKQEGILYVKASGQALATITARGFVRMDMAAMAVMWSKHYPEETNAREQDVLVDLMGARCANETERPSVEALLHAIIPFKFVVHVHPTVVNGMTCGNAGEAACRTLFPDSLWIPLVDPGYMLAKTVKEAMQSCRDRRGTIPAVIFLQNHGLFVGAETVAGIDETIAHIMRTVQAALVRKPSLDAVVPDQSRFSIAKQALDAYWQPELAQAAFNRELQMRLADAIRFWPVSSAFTPDHIVYSGFAPLFIGDDVFGTADPKREIAKRCEAFEQANAMKPKVVALQGTAVFASSQLALSLFLDTVKVAAFSESFGGPRFMSAEHITFIREWEVESYRAKMASS